MIHLDSEKNIFEVKWNFSFNNIYVINILILIKDI